jgi:uroporphyrin-III C-methyltransferase/precorrin-2 dehydrogenase/sirohydrochlorin ferrochelatase
MAALERLPVFFALDSKRALVAGGSAAAAWKAELLSAAGAHVDVYATDVTDELRSVASDPPRGAVTMHRRVWASDDFAGAAIAVGACDNDRDAERFAAAARAAGVPVNVIDRPDFCDFSFGSIVNRSPLVIGISTAGAAPVFAQAIRAKFEAMLPQGFAAWARAAADWRTALKRSGLSFNARRTFWQLFTARAISRPNQPPRDTDFTSLLDAVRSFGGATEQGAVTLVGAGPGDPELLTLRAVRALQSADVILFDDLVSHDVLDFARREAKKMLVGKSGHGPSCTQSDINVLIVQLAKAGKRVVRLKGGDPLIFGRAGEEIDACKAAGIAVEIVPGISAAQGAAGRLGVPLTDRAHARRVQFITGHAADGELPRDIDWSALADPATTTAIYMPVRTLAALVEKAIEQGLDPATPAIAVSRATRQDQAVIAERITALPAAIARTSLPGPVTVLVGWVYAGLLSDADSANRNAAASAKEIAAR